MLGKMESQEFTSLKGNISNSYNDLDYNVVLFERVEQVAGCSISSPSGISNGLVFLDKLFSPSVSQFELCFFFWECIQT
jgi:hypothetical protein